MCEWLRVLSEREGNFKRVGVNGEEGHSQGERERERESRYLVGRECSEDRRRKKY